MIKEEFMREAIAMAKLAYQEGEVPVGAVIEYKGQIIGRGRNKRVDGKLTIAHAEIMAIMEACRYINDFRLEGTNLYTTLEPCIMCTGAILEARIGKIIIGARDMKKGSISSVNKLALIKGYKLPSYEFGILEDECGELLSNFFEELRFR